MTKRAKAPKVERPNGRPSKRDPLLLAAIVARVRQGERVHTAAEAEGVASRTVAYWLNGDDADPALCSFRQDVARARAQYLSDRLAVVRAAEVAVGRESDGSPVMAPDPKWAAWELERADPEHYAATQVLLVKAEETVSAELLSLLRGALSPSAWAEVVAALRRGDGDEEAEHLEH